MEMEELGQLQFTIEECAIILSVDYDELLQKMSDLKNQCRIDYDRGRMQAIADIRRMMLIQAQNGDVSAQAEFMKLIERANEMLPW